MNSSDFQYVSKHDWLQQVAKDLKGIPMSDLGWKIADDLQMSPFVHPDDFEARQAPLWSVAKNWEISELIETNDPANANAQALAALNGGAEGLQFVFNTNLDWASFQQIFNKIYVEMTGLHFSGVAVSQNPAEYLGRLLQLATGTQSDPKILKGSVDYAPLQQGNLLQDWRYLVDLMEFASESLPNFKIINIRVPNLDNPATALAQAFNFVNAYFEKLSKHGIPLDKASTRLQFSIELGKSYFLEISKMRAMHLLWFNVSKAWGIPVSQPLLSASIKQEAYSEELYTNMVSATTIAMSAVLGGADRLTVLPYDADRAEKSAYPPDFGRRIARNVQHLLKMESALVEMADPAVGSYYIEKLTEAIAEKAWEQVQGA